MKETFNVQLKSAGTKKHGEGRIVFSVSKYAFHKLHDMQEIQEDENGLVFWIVGAEKLKIDCHIDWMKSKIGSNTPRKVVLQTPETEQQKIGELCNLTNENFQAVFKTKNHE